MNRKEHWENIYTTKQPNEVSWTQAIPETSLSLISELNLNTNASIIDIGGGDSNTKDHLLKLGFTNLSVLDISKAAIDRAKKRLGAKAHLVQWIVSDIVEFSPNQVYDIWHDRAVFHFLTSKEDIDTYKQLVENHAKNMVLGTFATNGPFKCSGLTITQYDKAKFKETFSPSFSIKKFRSQTHATPFDTTQKFVYALFRNEV